MLTSRQPRPAGPVRRRRRSGLMREIGPELISGAADNDPTNVGTATSVGAHTAYRLSWAALLVGPLLYVVLVIAAQVGMSTGADLQSLARRRYGRRISALLLISVVAVNAATIAADLQAGAAGIGLLTGADPRWLVLPLGLAVAGLLLAGRYGQVIAVLRFVLPGFFAFTAAAVLARPDWPAVLKASVVPSLSWHGAELIGALALTGTALTSYVYVWETIQRGAEGPGRSQPGQRASRPRSGAAVGAAFTAIILWSMLVAAAATLGRHSQAALTVTAAARALRPLAGPYAADMFALGLVVSSVVALPVLIACTAYVAGAHFGWRRGLSRPISRAGRFYAAMAAPLGIAVIVALAGVPVLDTLVAASVLGGLATPVGLVLLLLLARDRQVMSGRPISVPLAVAGWLITIAVGGLGLLFVATAAFGIT